MKIICITPVRNEAWILKMFLEEASKWADQIIIRDQCSNDGSLEIAKSFEKVTLIEAANNGFDEAQRRKDLLEAARAIPGENAIIALDADEFLVGDIENELKQFLKTKPGTALIMRWPQSLPHSKQCWEPKDYPRFGFIDDGREYEEAPTIHTPRVPVFSEESSFESKNISVLHLQFLPEKRNRAKQRYYQCFERVNYSSKSAIDIYRQYNKLNKLNPNDLRLMTEIELALIQKAETHIKEEESCHYYFDEEVVAFFEKYTTQNFRQLDIWDTDWNSLALKLGKKSIVNNFTDPRSSFEKLVHRWLWRTDSNQNLIVRIAQKLLKVFGW